MRAILIISRLGVIRGFVVGILGAFVGFALTNLVRAAYGFDTSWDIFNEELHVVGSPLGVPLAIASIFFTLSFLVGVGTVTDWLKWSVGIEGSDGHYHAKPGMPTWARYFGMDTNHKVVGIQYGITSMIFMGLGGFFALAMRTELLTPELDVISHDTFNTYIGMHGMVMIVAILVGIGALANYLVPLMIGAQDMAFPRLNGFAFWINIPAGVLLSLAPMFGGFDTGWTAYPPLSVRADLGMQFFLLAIFIAGFSSILGALNLLTTIFLMRAPGMSLFRIPIFVWGIVATSLIQLTATQYIALSFLMVFIERLVGIPFFDPSLGGNVTLFQHLFWFYSHPAVYVFVLPGFGVISELLPVFARKPLYGYVPIALSSLTIAVLGYLVWAHHMWTSAMSEDLRVPFMFMTMLVAVPTGVKFFSWLGTLWGGSIRLATPMYFMIGAFMVFLMGGLTGPPNAILPTGLQLHDTYFIVGHFHMTIFGGFTFTFFGALYYWYPKMTGKMYSELFGQMHFWMMFLGFSLQALTMLYVGLNGMNRRYAEYQEALEITTAMKLTTAGGYVVFVSVLLMAGNMVFSLFYGQKAVPNPWNSLGLEWQISSPPPELNYSELPRIVGDPYDYGKEGAVYGIVAEADRAANPPVEPKSSGPVPMTPEIAPSPAGD